MPRQAKALTALEISRCLAPGTIAVGTVPGLHLVIKPSGARSWVLRVLVGTKRREIGLGGYPAVTLAQAHAKARDAREKIAQGIDPLAERQAARSALLASQAADVTFAQCFKEFLDKHGDSWRNAKHRAQWESTLETYAFPTLGRMIVRDIEKEHVRAVLDPIWREKPETASRVRGRIEQVLSYAMQANYRPGGLNPARWKGNLDLLLPARSRTKKVKHHTALPYVELGGFMAQLRKQDGLGALALQLVILTACRSGEARGATWDEIDLDAATWVIPEERMKAGVQHKVPLSKQAVELLRGLPKIKGTELIFPGTKGQPLSDMTLSAVMRRMEVDAVPHGFRTTFRTWAGDRTSFQWEVMEKSLAHKVGDETTRAYDRGELFEKRRALMQAWADFCDQPSVQAGNVTPIRGAA